MNKLSILKHTLSLAVAGMAFTALPTMAQTPPSPNAMPTGTYTFAGTTKLVNGQSATCTLSLVGTVTNTTNPDGVYIDITSGTVMPPQFTCSFISLSGFTATQTGQPGSPGPWEAWKSDAAIQADLNANSLGPVDFVVNAVTVSAPFYGTCTGDVQASFFNGTSAIGGPSYFAFNDTFDGCAVQTLDPTGLEVVPAASSNPDVNVQ